jgi:adenylate kinase family enzyme
VSRILRAHAARLPAWAAEPRRQVAYPTRINVTGNAGAGKTSLARELGRALDLPVYSLDSIVWQPRWRKTPPVEREALELGLIRRSTWIIDGVSARVRHAADWVILLDVPRHVCAWRGLRRSFRYLHRTRPELPENCPEWRIVPRLLGIIWRFPSQAGVAIAREATRDSTKYSIISRADRIESVLARIPARKTCC